MLILWSVPSLAQECACTPCHGSLETVHGDFNHAAVPGSGPVALFADNAHDDAGQYGTQPYFAVQVDCTICHYNDLMTVHGKDCATCHPTPYDTLGIWGKGCQQGACHPFYHEDATTAHLPYEDPYDPENDCYRCHNPSFYVEQSKCQNCHTTLYGSADTSPPVTTSNAQYEYNGPARIGFSITDNGKVGIGRTFYRLDGGTASATGKHLFIADPGSYLLEFWSMDQSGNTESAANTVSFTIVQDTVPPTTTSNAAASYSQGAVITLSATDNSSLGVKTTYYRLDSGPIQAGTSVTVAGTSGTVTHILAFWSEDWAGNVETENSVSFTVTSGAGTLRLVWGNSDTAGSPCPDDPAAKASWIVRSDSSSGPIVASGSGSCPNWDGIDDVARPTGPTSYFVSVEWWDSFAGFYEITNFSSINVVTPGQIILLRY